MAEDNRCGGVCSEGNKNDNGLGTCENSIQLNMDSTECGLVLGVWFARVVEEGVISLW